MTTTIDGSSGVTTNAGGLVNPSTTIDGINYSCRAWVNFNGVGTVAIRASGNVTSITDNGTGDYTINFTTAMVDANYSAQVTVDTRSFACYHATSPFTTSSLRIDIDDNAGAQVDRTNVTASIFR